MNVNAKKPVAFTTGLSIPTGTPAADQDAPTIVCSQQATRQKEPFPWTWRGAEFVRVTPGKYEAICVGYRGPEYVPAYRRYSLILFFLLLADDVEVAMFFNFGSNPKRRPGPLSRYFVAWVKTNGERPRRGQSMSPEIFTTPGLIYTIRVVDANIDAAKADKPPCLIYSRAEEILEVHRP